MSKCDKCDKCNDTGMVKGEPCSKCSLRKIRKSRPLGGGTTGSDRLVVPKIDNGEELFIKGD